jgi:hypothetical protein
MQKTCTKCHVTKDISLFHIRRERPHCTRSWCKSCIHEGAEIWANKNPERARKMDEGCTKRTRDKARFSSLRSVVFERDNNECIECGMTQVEHKAIWNKSLTIHHKDGKGRYAKPPNNALSNLETLCLRCHGWKDYLLFIGGK